MPETPKTEESPRPETVNNTRNFWRTTGCATVTAAVLGLGGTILAQQLGKKDSDSGTVSGSAVPAVPVPGPAVPGSGAPGMSRTGSAPVSTAASDIRWQGKFALTSYPDFDSLPPKDHAGGSLSQDVYGSFHPQGNGAVWTEDRVPSKQECADIVDTQSADRIDPAPGMHICLKIGRGRVVYFTILGEGERETAGYRYQTQLIVWN